MFSLKSNADDWWLEANCKIVLNMKAADLTQAEPWKLDVERETTVNLTQGFQAKMSPESFERLQQRCIDFAGGSN